MALIEHSSLFDHDWYLEHYSDVAGSGVDPARHYLIYGWHEGRDPGPGFSTTAYLRANADVAELGINPLLHYVEYGHSEGRGAPDHAAPAPMPTPPLEAFGPAAPCASFALDAVPPARWKRHGDAGAGSDEELVVGGYFVGSYRDDLTRLGVEAGLALMAHLSGSHEPFASPTLITPPVVQLVDAWHTDAVRIRTRWARTEGADPMVVRALQHHRGAPMLVGEGLTDHHLDIVDARPANPYFPLFFVFANPDGTILGCRLLAFPSLCRGGLHYPELIALAQAQPTATVDPIDILAVSDGLAAQLVALGSGAEQPLLSSIHVDLEGGDGTHPLFQSDFKKWLAAVARISIEPVGGAGDDPTGQFLAKAVQAASDSSRSAGAGTLVLASDMIPAISALVAHASSKERGAGPMMVPFVVAGEEYSQPSVLIKVPPEWSVAGLSNVIPAYPRFEPAGGGVPAASLRLAALRMPRSRPLGDADLLVPMAEPNLALPSHCQPSTWLVWPCEWSEEVLLEMLGSLAVQAHAGPVSLLLVGPCSPAVDALARRLFERVDVVGGLSDALVRIGTPLIGYIGPGVVFHDRRAVAVMTAALDDATVGTASVALVSVEKRGKGWVVALADCGEILTASATRSPVDKDAFNALPLWRSAWPVMRPPRDLWMTRTETLLGWTPQPGATGQHFCTAVISASYGEPRSSLAARLKPPRSNSALEIEQVVG